MHMNTGSFHEPDHFFIIFEGLTGVQPTLKEDLGAAELLRFPDLGFKLGKGQEIAALFLGRLEKSAELAGGDTDIGVIDIAVDHIGDSFFRMQTFADGAGEKAEIVETAFLFQVQKILVGYPDTGLDIAVNILQPWIGHVLAGHYSYT